jgi:hypothetical protein
VEHARRESIALRRRHNRELGRLGHYPHVSKPSVVDAQCLEPLTLEDRSGRDVDAPR